MHGLTERGMSSVVPCNLFPVTSNKIGDSQMGEHKICSDCNLTYTRFIHSHCMQSLISIGSWHIHRVNWQIGCFLNNLGSAEYKTVALTWILVWTSCVNYDMTSLHSRLQKKHADFGNIQMLNALHNQLNNFFYNVSHNSMNILTCII